MNSEVKLALQAELAQQQRSMVQFSVQVASLCKKHGVEATQQACRLLLTESPPMQSDGDVGIDEDYSVTLPTPLGRQGNLLSSDVAASDSTEPVVRPSHKTRKDRSSEISDRDDESITTTAMMHKTSSQFRGRVPAHVLLDSRFKNLPFIDPVRGVEEPLPKLVYMLGPRFWPFYNAVMGWLQAWHPMDNAFADFVKGVTFQCLVALLIVANFVFIAVRANWHASHVGQDEPYQFSLFSHFFTSLYTIELAINLVVHGGTFWTGGDCFWNVFDFCIVFMGLIETGITLSGGDFFDASFLRMLRFARISRVLRMFSAVRLFKEIRIMVDTLVGSLSIFFWVTALFALIIALFAIFFVQGYSSHMDTRPGGNNYLLKEYYGSVSAAMLSLFKCATGGSDWKPYYDEAAKMGAHYKYLIMFFIGFYNFSFFNVITGVFCEKALSLAAPSLEERLSERYQKEFNDARELYQLLNDHLNSKEGKHASMERIDAQRFEDFMDEPTVERFFEVRGLGPASACRFFRMLCELNGTYSVDLPTFVSACVKLDGTASSIDLHVLSVRQLFGMHQLQSLQRRTHQDLETTKRELTDHLDDMLNKKFASLHNSWREDFQNSNAPKLNAPKLSMPSTSPPTGENRSTADFTSSVTSAWVGEMRSMLAEISSEMIELKSIPSQIQLMQSQIQRDLQRPLSEEKYDSKHGFGEPTQRALEESQQRASEAMQQLQIQHRVQEDLQVQLAHQQKENDDIITHLKSMSQQKEGELKMMLAETTKRWEQTQMELQREIWRNEPRDRTRIDNWCLNPRVCGTATSNISSRTMPTTQFEAQPSPPETLPVRLPSGPHQSLTTF